MPMYDYKYLLSEALDGASAANVNSTNEVNFGVAEPDCATQHPFGAHIVITQSYTDMNSGIDVKVFHGAATGPTTELIRRRFTKAQWVAGKHYFIPFPPKNLQYVRLRYTPISETSTLGHHTAWLGPLTGDEE